MNSKFFKMTNLAIMSNAHFYRLKFAFALFVRFCSVLIFSKHFRMFTQTFSQFSTIQTCPNSSKTLAQGLDSLI